MDYSIQDFSKLKFRVDLVEDYNVNLLETFPELKKYKEFQQLPTIINSVKTFKYIVLVYDKQSPLLIIDNISKRKTQAAILSKFDKDKTGSISQSYIDMMNGENSIVNKWVIRYFKLMDDVSFVNMIVYKEKLHQQHEALMAETDEKKIATISTNIKTFTDFYSESKKTFQQGDTATFGLNEEIRIGIEQEDIPTPESVAYSLRDGIDPTVEWSPYGKNYVPVLQMANIRKIYKPGEDIPPLTHKEK